MSLGWPDGKMEKKRERTRVGSGRRRKKAKSEEVMGAEEGRGKGEAVRP